MSSGAQHLQPTSRWRRRARRTVRTVAIALGGTVLVLGVWVVALLVTNTDPTDQPGWVRGADLAGGRGEVAAASDGERLIVVGGLEGIGRTTASVHAYDPGADAWESLPDLPAPRHHAAAAALDDGTVVVAGGARSARDWSPRADAWALVPGASGWEPLPAMPEGRVGHDLVALDGRVHVVGGDGDTSDVLTLDLTAGAADAADISDRAPAAWERGAPLGRSPDHVRAVVLDGEVWALGGREGDLVARVDVYDPGTDTWRAGPDLPRGTSAMAVGVLEGAIHVVGGEDPRLLGGRVHATHLRLDPVRGEWELVGEPMLAVHGAGAGVVDDDELVVVGGARRQGVLSVLSWTGVTQRYRPGS